MNQWRALMSTFDKEFKPEEEARAKGLQHQSIKGWTVTEEMIDSLQLLLLAA